MSDTNNNLAQIIKREIDIENEIRDIRKEIKDRIGDLLEQLKAFRDEAAACKHARRVEAIKQLQLPLE